MTIICINEAEIGNTAKSGNIVDLENKLQLHRLKFKTFCSLMIDLTVLYLIKFYVVHVE